MEKIKIWNNDLSEKQLNRVAEVLDAGGVIILPTDTLYGIACDSANSKAIEKICKMKGLNPDKNTLSIICPDISMAAEYSKFNNETFRLLKENTPGAFTFVFKAASALPKAFKGRKTVGVRIPDCAAAVKIAERLGRPLMNASIDFQDEDYAVNPELIADNYDSKADLMLMGEDGGLMPSTIIDFTGSEPVVERQGKGELQ